ncbi:MAG: nuclear transport factor 2 family protein [Chitinophagaceae bacterium]
MKKLTPLIFLIFTTCIYSCQQSAKPPGGSTDILNEQKAIAAMLDSFNTAAANADYTTYFNFYTDDAIFTGTDATERWNKQEYMAWAKPYFDKKTTWHFTALERHIYFDKTGNLAWFDELLNTQMKICRGSGVVVKQGDAWKVQQYILSTTIPNELIDSVTKIKAPIEDKLIEQLSHK